MSKYIAVALDPESTPGCHGCVLEHGFFGACKSFLDARVEEGLASCLERRVVYKELKYSVKIVNQQTCTGCVQVNSSTLNCNKFIKDRIKEGLPNCEVKDIIYVKA